MLLAHNVAFDEHHYRLIEPTDFSAPEGQLALLHSSTALARTALALIASGRMQPDAGNVWYEDAGDPEQSAATGLRRRTALVDSPGITAPEHHMTVRQVVSEALALRPVSAETAGAPGRRRARRPPLRSLDWLARHQMDHLAKEKLVALDAESRLRLLIELAFADPAIRCAVVDSPDRHRIAADDLLCILDSLADADQPRAILAVVAHVPQEEAGWAPSVISFADEAGSGTLTARLFDEQAERIPEPADPADEGRQPHEAAEMQESAETEEVPEGSDDLSALGSMMEDDR